MSLRYLYVAVIGFISITGCQKSPVSRGIWPVEESLENMRSGEVICEVSGSMVRFVGKTDLNLVQCLLSNSSDGASLIITSTGGPVKDAIWASEIIDERNMSVEVVGFCGSSCANYLLPVGNRVLLHAGSVIAVHGAPVPPSEEHYRDLFAKLGRETKGIEFETNLKMLMENAQSEYRLHEWYLQNHDVGKLYYDLSSVWDSIPEEQHDNLLIGVDAVAARDCWGISPVLEYLNEGMTAKHQSDNFPNSSIMYLSEIEGWEGCRP